MAVRGMAPTGLSWLSRAAGGTFVGDVGLEHDHAVVVDGLDDATAVEDEGFEAWQLPHQSP